MEGYGGDKPILVVLAHGKDVIMRNAFHLAATKFYIESQLPPELKEEKRQVQQIYREAKKQGKRPKFVGKGNVVMVDNERYEANKLPTNKASISVILDHVHNMNIHTT